MADFNVLSPKGPDVNQNLIVDAKLKGAQTGQLTPSVTQSIIEGGIKGVGQGLEIAQGIQTIQRNQQLIDREPLAAQQAQAEIERTQAQTAEIQSRSSQQDPADQMNQLRLQQAQQAVAEENALMSEYQSLSGNPQAQGQLLLSGKHDKYFGSEPGTFQQMIETTRQRGGLSDAQYDSLYKKAQKSQISNQYEKELEKNIIDLEKLQPGWEQNPVRYELAEKLQVNPDQALTEVEFYANGTFPIVEQRIPGTNKTRLVRGEKGTKPEDMLLTPNRDQVDIFARDGQFIGTVSKDQADSARQYRDKLNSVTGLARNRDIENVDKGKGSPTAPGNEVPKTEGATPEQPAPAAAKKEPTMQTAFSLSENDPERTRILKNTLRVSDDVAEANAFDAPKLMSDIQEIGKATAYQGVNVFAKPVEVEPLRRSVETSVREIITAQGFADSQNSEIGRVMYSQENVEAFKQSLRETPVGQARARGVRSFGSPNYVLPNGSTVSYSDAESVVTPEDLYYVLNKKSIDAEAKLKTDQAVSEATNYYKAPIQGENKGRDIGNKRSSTATSGVRWPERPNARAASAPEAQMQTPMQATTPEATPEGLIQPAANDVALTIRPGLEEKRMSGYADKITQYASEQGLPPNLVAAVIWQESTGRPDAVGPYLPKYRTNAKGLMQFLPSTLKEMGYDDPFNPEQSIAAGSKYLKQLWDRYGSVELALAAYNWGMGNLDEYRAGEKKTIPTQTAKYVRSIMTDFNNRNQQRKPSAQTT